MQTQTGFALLLLRLATLLAAFAATCGAQDGDVRRFDLAEGPASVTLKRFAAQAACEIVFSPREVGDARTRPVQGDFRPREALDRMLENTGLAASADPKTGAFAVKKKPASNRQDSPEPPARERSAAPATVEGRVLNAATEAYVARARVTLEGTGLETLTDDTGFYRIVGAPAGAARLAVFFTGLAPTSEPLVLEPGRTERRDVRLAMLDAAKNTADEPIVLSTFTVGASREMAGSAIAINERRFAPNLVNVISTEEFGTIPDGSVGEFLKFVPGVNIDYTGGVANTISLDGAPSGNVPVTLGGFNLATTASGDPSVRQNELLQVSINNISRVEVLLSPTPESPASALAGSVNFVPKSAFERVRPQFTFNAYVSMRDDERSLRKTPGPRKKPTYKLQPGFDLSYIRPVNDRFGFTLSAGQGNQYTSEDRATTQWRAVSAATNPGSGLPDTTPDKPYLTRYAFSDRVKFNGRSSASMTADYRLGPNDRISAGFSYAAFTSEWSFNELAFQLNQVNDGFTGQSVHSKAGRGELSITQTSREREGYTYTPTFVYRHAGPLWNAEAGLALSASHNKFYESDHGMFGSSTLRRTNATIDFDDIQKLRPNAIAVRDGTSGTEVNPFALDSYTIASATSIPTAVTKDVQRSAYANLSRVFSAPFGPLAFKTGLDVRDQVRDTRGGTRSYTFLGADRRGTTTPTDPQGSDDKAGILYDSQLSQRAQPFGFPKVEWPSNDRLWSLYESDPASFRLDENAAYRSDVSASRRANETISSLFVRIDLGLLGNRLRVVGGVRAEQTNVRAQGPLSDPTLNYQHDSLGQVIPRRDATGNIMLDANGNPLPALIVPTTDSLGVSRRTYLERGYRVDKEYLRWFPSVNATYSIFENLLLKGACYQSIGRPAFSQYSGGLTLPDTEAPPSASNRISVNNANIKPWQARTFKVRLEYYFQGGSSQVSVGAVRRFYKRFFGSTVFPATKSFLQTYGVDADQYLEYDVQTNYNVEEQVRSDGLEAEFSQTLKFLPAWCGTVQVRGNVGTLRFLGPAASNFANFVPRTINAMIYLRKPSYSVRVGWNHTARRRGAIVTGRGIEEGTYSWVAPRLYTDVEVQYFLTKHLSVYANLRNICDEPQDGETFGPNTPDYARFRTRSQFGSLWTIGVNGRF